MPILFLIFWFCLTAVCLAAYVWGGWPERMGAALYAGAALMTIAAHSLFHVQYAEVDGAVFAIDLLLLLGLAFVAVRSDRWWPSCALALQSLTVLAHVGKLINPHFWRLGYQLMATWTALPSLAVIGFGLWGCRRRRLRSAGTSS